MLPTRQPRRPGLAFTQGKLTKVKKLKSPIGWLVLIVVVAAFSAPFGTPQLAAFAKDFLPAVATLVAAYAGVRYANELNQVSAARDQKSKQIGIGARAMFILWRQINSIAQIQEDVISKYRNYPPAPLAMPPIEHYFDESARLDIDGLMFLLDHGKPELLANLHLTEIRYLQAIDALRKRSLLHKEEIQPKIEGKQPIDRNLTPDELKELVGIRLFGELIWQTNRAISATDDAVAALESVAKDLHQALRSIFPESRFPSPAPMTDPPKDAEERLRPSGLL